jgi:hypothetical protein
MEMDKLGTHFAENLPARMAEAQGNLVNTFALIAAHSCTLRCPGQRLLKIAFTTLTGSYRPANNSREKVI